MYSYPIEIAHIFISPQHNYFGKPKNGPAEAPTHDLESVEAHAGLGLYGDRYFGVPAHFDAQVTFFAGEVFQALMTEFGLEGLSPVLARRNIVTYGANLNQLLGHEFTLVCGQDTVHLAGAKACSPCAWMDAMFAPGAHAFLRGRGGLRARILSDGTIRRGPALLQSALPLDVDVEQLRAALPKPKLP
jgi:MOSC domain-containing protein YiiM